MAKGVGKARVTNSEVFKNLRPWVIKFMEESQAAISSADADAGRTLSWIQTEQAPYWKREMRRAEEELTRAKSELMRKQQGPDGKPKPAVEEKKAVEQCKRRVDHCREKITACQRWSRELEKAISSYKGQVQALNNLLASDLPDAVSALDKMATAIEAYTARQRSDGAGSHSS